MRQRLGQHFLHDENVTRRMLELSPVQKGHVVVEVGPGQGVLTDALLSRGYTVVAIEWDELLVAELQKRFADKRNIFIVHADIRTFNILTFLASISDKKKIEYSIIANLPYYLTSYLLRQVFELSQLPLHMTLLMQKEVAERLCAPPPSSQRSVLSVMVQAYSQPKLEMLVPAGAFVPPPRVESAVVTFGAISNAYFAGLDKKKFWRMVKAGFGEKRKRLANSLAGGLVRDKSDMDKLLDDLGFNDDARAQELTLEDWKKLYHALERI